MADLSVAPRPGEPAGPAAPVVAGAAARSRRFMRSGGGSMTSTAARTSPTHTVLFGPAGGIVGAGYLAELLGRDDLLTFDIGGTSLDTCVIERGTAVAAYEAELEHFPLLIPTYDIRTIGAGGGSIAWLDRGLLKVGPHSAGAEPGPVCYGRGGTQPTVTDAAVVLGYLDPDRFLGGAMRLDAAAARVALEEQVARPLGRSSSAAAAGVYDVLLARTVGAVRQITVERGHDPRQFSLLAYGGAGPLLAPLLARERGIQEVVVPAAPAAFSAWGMLSADVVNDYSRTVMAPLAGLDLAELARLFQQVAADAAGSLAEQGVPAERTVLEWSLELRYQGQEHSLIVPVGRELDPTAIRAAFDGDPVRALVGHRDAYDFGQRGVVAFAVYDRGKLAPGDQFAGPALVDEGTATTVVPGGARVTVNEFGHLLVTTTGGA